MKRNNSPAILEVIGYSGAGKTTLIEKLIPALRKRGIRLAVIKHTSHRHELDQPGKDSYRLRKAGAEGFRNSEYPCIEVYRRGVSPDLKCRAHQNLLAVVGDDPGALAVPRFNRDDVRAITEFLLQKLSLPSKTKYALARTFPA